MQHLSEFRISGFLFPQVVQKH